MTSPRRKPRWSAEKRAAKGLEPNRPRGKRSAGAPKAGAPKNRKERRAAEFGDAHRKFADPYRDRDEHPRQGELRQEWAPRRPKHEYGRPYPEGRRERRDNQGFREDRRDFPAREDRFEQRGPHQERKPRSERADRQNGAERHDFRHAERAQRSKDRPWQDRRSHRDPREAKAERFGPRAEQCDFRKDRDDRPRSERRKPHHSLDRDPSHRGRVEHRRRFDERPAPAAADQMSWSAQVGEEFTGELATGFLELGVAEPMVRVLASQGITEPFPIQAATIGDARAGRDVLGRGRTGSGKTLAFGLPMLTRLAECPSIGAPRAMVLTPTRELALQIADNLSPLASAVGLDLTLVAGGMSYDPQIRAFERGVDVVIATPGRLIDLLEQGVADLSQVEISVLDEADHMADMGFLQEVRTLLDATAESGQRLLFSATLDEAVGSLVERYLNDPVTHEVDSGQASVSTMVHRPFLVKPHHKNQLTAEIANREGRTVLFARTQMGTDRIAGQLREAGVMAGALHGGLTQGARARILAAFREGTVPVLVATDVAARGIHVDDVTLVLQVDPPRDSKDYLHRAGRTARAGQAGIVATIVLPHQRKLGQRLLGQAGVKAPLIEMEPGTPQLREATGARTPSGVPIEESAYLALIAPKQARRSGPPRGGRRPRNRRY